MDKGKCTPGVYLIIGKRGVRVGQSGCMETRMQAVKREFEGCIGKPKHVLQIPVIGRKERLALEHDLIKALDPKCNIAGRKRGYKNR
ncbi:MAG TPA: hypothetical protein VMX96_00395 [Dehalococcoidia bacterium]|nr:hypothetical protein [Dehalococcoidia bacterium]